MRKKRPKYYLRLLLKVAPQFNTISPKYYECSPFDFDLCFECYEVVLIKNGANQNLNGEDSYISEHDTNTNTEME